MRRRLDLAASLLARAEVYFLDEPTTGLAPASRAQVHQVIRALAADGATVLLPPSTWTRPTSSPPGSRSSTTGP
jgi:ABC-type multidrug transport system ATPase subunit